MKYGANVLIALIISGLLSNVARGVAVKSDELNYTSIPLFFGTNMDYQEYSILPPKVILTRVQVFDEGFSRYALKVKVENGFDGIVKNDGVIHPIWLSSASDVDVESLIRYHPISKSDLMLIIKSSGITRPQLIDILRKWDDEIERE